MDQTAHILRLVITSLALVVTCGLDLTAHAGEGVEFCGKTYTLDVTEIECSDRTVSDLTPLKGLSNLQML